MINDEIQRHCAEINRCNQRGGRMLSIVDLIEAGTITTDLAAYSLAAINNGASFMVGAVSGGAGKTTVMGALLNFMPRDVQLVHAADITVIEGGLINQTPRCCYICHEIGSGPYYAYLWGGALRNYFKLPLAGHMIATNLHADTYVEARRQLCGDNDVSPSAFRCMNLIFFMMVTRRGWTPSRRITEVWESDGESEHQQIFGPDNSILLLESSRCISPNNFEKARKDMDQLMTSGVRKIEDVRSKLLERQT